MKSVRQGYEGFARDKDPLKLVQTVLRLKEVIGEAESSNTVTSPTIKSEDLHLICFDYICC